MSLYSCPICWDHHRPWCSDAATILEALQPVAAVEREYRVFESEDYKILVPVREEKS